MSNLYTNENYEVFVENGHHLTVDGNDFHGVYCLRNLKTGIVEFRTPALPEALHLAVQWDVALQRESHLWPYKKLEGEQAAEPTLELMQ